MTIPSALFPYLSQEIPLVRHSDDGNVVIGYLPDLRKLFFPTRLSLEPLGPTQFVLHGENTESIAAVALQNGKTSRIFTVASGIDYSIVTLPDSTPTKSPDNSSNTSSGPANSTVAEITSSDASTNMKVTKTAAKSPAPPKSGLSNTGLPGASQTQKDDASSADQPLAPGTYTVIPLIQTGETLQTKVTKGTVKPPPNPHTPAPTSGTPTGHGAPATSTVPLTSTNPAAPANPPAGTPQPPTTTPASKPPAPTTTTTTTVVPQYMPLQVSDVAGKPLIFTVADPKKGATTTTTTTPSAPMCAAPCILQPCAASCAKPPTSTSP